MRVIQANSKTRGHFQALDGEHQAGLMTYVWAEENLFIIDHTEVDSDYGGQGVGKQMVMAAVEFARESGVKILPLCPFAKSVFDKTPEIRDVLR